MRQFDRDPRGAEPIYREALDMARALYPEDHHETATILGEYARDVRDLGRLGEAEAIAREAMAMFGRLYGARHRETMISSQTLASVLRAQARLEDAEHLLRGALETARTLFEDGHPMTLGASRSLAYGHWADARYDPPTAIVPVRASELAGRAVELSGYPADKCGATACVSVCNPASPGPYEAVRGNAAWASMQWTAPGTIQRDPPPGLILYDVDTCTGVSGSPVWTRRRRGGRESLELVAIHTGHYTRANPVTKAAETLGRGIPLVAQLRDLLRDRVRREKLMPTF